MYIVVIGNPVDGFNFVGPFPDEEAANDYADTLHSTSEWWVADLTPPGSE